MKRTKIKYKLRPLALTITLLFTSVFGFSLKSQEYKWGNLPIGGGGYVTGMVIHPKNKDIMYIRTDVGGAYRWNAKTKEWEQMLNWVGPRNSNLVGVDGIALDPGKPDRVYLALGRALNSEGGIFRSEDRGKTWEKLIDMSFESNGREARWIGECIAVDPLNSGVIYTGTRTNGLWRSVDDGKTWSKIADVPDGFTGTHPTGVRVICIDPSKRISQPISTSTKQHISRSTKCSSTIYVGVPKIGIYGSQDGGVSFSLINDSPKNPACLQVSDGMLFVTHDKGVACFSKGVWKDISPSNMNFVGLAVDQTDKRKIIAAEHYNKFNNSIYRTKDMGATWEKINSESAPANFHITIPWWPKSWFSSATAAMALVPGGSGGLYFSDWFGVWHTPDVWVKSTDWYPIEKGHEETVVLSLVAPPSGALVYSGMADIFGFRHDKSDSYPTKRLYPLQECFSIAVCESKPSNIACLGAKSWGGDKSVLITSSDFGETWLQHALPQGEILGRIAISSLNPDQLVYISGSGKVYYSHNRGESWAAGKKAPENVISHINIWNREKVLVPDLVKGGFYIFKDGVIYTSDDGSDWNTKNAIPLSSSSWRLKNISSVPGRSGELWICLEKEGLWKTNDAGNTYSRIVEFDNAKHICWGANAPGSVFPTAYCYGMMKEKWGIYRSTDMGENWVQINDDDHQFPGGVAVIEADRNTFGRVYIGSGGCGVYYGNLDQTKFSNNAKR